MAEQIVAAALAAAAVAGDSQKRLVAIGHHVARSARLPQAVAAVAASHGAMSSAPVVQQHRVAAATAQGSTPAGCQRNYCWMQTCTQHQPSQPVRCVSMPCGDTLPALAGTLAHRAARVKSHPLTPALSEHVRSNVNQIATPALPAESHHV